jgi:hypothetical protein
MKLLWLFAAAGWLAFLGTLVQIQKVDVTLDSGKQYSETRLLPPWVDSLDYELSDYGSYSSTTSYVYGIFADAKLAGGSKIHGGGGHSH